MRHLKGTSAISSPYSTPLHYDGKYATLLMFAIWVLVVFMVVPDGFKYEIVVDADMPTTGSPMSRMLWLALLGVGFLFTIWRILLARVLILHGNLYFFAFVILAALSILWSIDPGVTIRRMIRVVTITFVAMSFVLVSWQPRSFQNALRPIFTILTIGSIIFAIAAPDLAIETSEDQAELVGAWKGLATQKNGLGSIAAMSTLLWLHAWISGQSRKHIAAFGVAVSVFCLLKSRSSTSLMGTLFASMLMLMLMYSPRGLRRYMPYLIGVFVGIILVYSLAVLHLVSGLDFLLTPITSFTGKDLTFSGRTAIWEIINAHIAQSPFLGTGYGAYWVGKVVTSPSYEMVQKLYFYPTESHNGYLDVINDLGILGGICLLGFMIVYLRQALQVLAFDKAQGALYLVLLFEQLIANLTESMWLSVRSLEFVIMTLAAMCLSRTVLQQKFIASAAAERARQATLSARSLGSSGIRRQ